MREIIFDAYDESTDTEGTLVYTVPDAAVITGTDAEADAESASLEAGTYPPRFIPGTVAA